MLYPSIFSNVPELPVMALVVPNFDDSKYLDVNDSGLIAKDLFGTFIALFTKYHVDYALLLFLRHITLFRYCIRFQRKWTEHLAHPFGR